MSNLRRLIKRDPLALLTILWPLVLLAPLTPGLPKPTSGGLPWSQELVLALLLCITLGQLAYRAFKSSGSSTFPRHELFVFFPLMLFVLWSAASLLWAPSVFPALHHSFLWASYLLFFLVVRRALKSPRLLRASLITLGTVICMISVACMVEYWGSSALLIRTSIGLGEPFAAALPIFTVLALRLRRRRAALFCGATAVLAWLAMLQSLERAPAIGATAALLLIAGGSAIKRSWRPRRLSRVVLLISFLAAATALQMLPSPAADSRPSPFARLQTTSEDANTRVRFLCWAVGLEMWRDRPMTGVGANNYDTVFPEARARFSANNPDSPLIRLNEGFLVERAHNEYVQILSELGVVGFALFLAFAVALIIAAWRALRHAQNALALGAAASLVAFAISSGASSVSFRWMGSGLVFFFSAALVLHLASSQPVAEKTVALSPAFRRPAMATALVLSLLILGGRGTQATSSIFQSRASSAPTAESVQRLYHSALAWNPYDSSAHFSFGMWLYLQRRAPEAVAHLRFAVEHGLNASVCYAYLAAAEAGAGDFLAAERTLERATRVYPRSVFLRVRHASALAEAGDTTKAEEEYREALALNPREARGWRQLICFGRNAAKTAAFYDKSIAMPGELVPENCIFAVLDENERRRPVRVFDEVSDFKIASR